jgi:prefoldin subunit 5
MKQVKLIQQPTDELDVMAVLKNALSFFSQYGKLLLIVAFAGMLAGGIRFYITPNLYSSSLVLKPTLLSDPEQLELINSWAALLKKRELPVLAGEFQVEENLLKKVISITTGELQKSISPNNFTAFTVTVLVTDTAVLAPLQKGLLYALDNSEYVKEKLEARKNILRTMIQTVQQEITRLTSIQAAVEASLQQNNTSGSRFLVSVSDISNHLATLQEKKLNYEENLAFASAVYVLQNFYVPSKPAHPQLIKQLAIGFGGGLFLGCAIACFLYVKRKLGQT